MLQAIEIITSDERTDNPETVNSEPQEWVFDANIRNNGSGKPDFVTEQISKVEQIRRNFKESDREHNEPMKGVKTSPSINVPNHIRGLYRFDELDRKNKLTQDFTMLTRDAKWGVVMVHECDHDKPPSERDGCEGWRIAHEKGQVPEHFRR